MKRLSIIIPSYNMEAFLAQCVDSLLQGATSGEIELIVVNDGSKDSTLRIALEYAESHPDTVRVIDKENGNYGSTINAALKVAQGEYVKILDADDRFDSALLPKFIEALKRVDGVDMLVTPFIEVGQSSRHTVGYNLYSRKVYEEGEIYDADKVFDDGAIRFFMMHGVCYRTALLREMHYRQSEGISYTDQEWVFYPLFGVKTIAFADIPLYLYNIAREGQTMDEKVQMRSLSQLATVTEAMAHHFIAHIGEVKSEVRRIFLRNMVADKIRILYRKYLLVMSDKGFGESDFKDVDSRFMHLMEQCQIETFDVPVNNLLRINLLRRWQHRGRRHSAFVRWALQRIDKTMAAVHAMIFR